MADSLCMPWTERIRASRVRENCTHGLKRAEAAGYTAPPLLDWLSLLLFCCSLLLAPSLSWFHLRFFVSPFSWFYSSGGEGDERIDIEDERYPSVSQDACA